MAHRVNPEINSISATFPMDMTKRNHFRYQNVSEHVAAMGNRGEALVTSSRGKVVYFPIPIEPDKYIAL